MGRRKQEKIEASARFCLKKKLNVPLMNIFRLQTIIGTQFLHLKILKVNPKVEITAINFTT